MARTASPTRIRPRTPPWKPLPITIPTPPVKPVPLVPRTQPQPEVTPQAKPQPVPIPEYWIPRPTGEELTIHTDEQERLAHDPKELPKQVADAVRDVESGGVIAW